MKRISLFAFLCISLSLTTCSKEDNLVDPQVAIFELIGDWEWVSSSGGITGEELSPDIVDETRQLYVTATEFICSRNNLEESRVMYDIKLDRSIFTTDSVQVIQLDGINAFTYELDGDRLILREEIYDGYNHLYERR